MLKKCEFCDAEFEAACESRRFCSRSCSKKYMHASWTPEKRLEVTNKRLATIESNGGLIPWNTGLTKETDDRLKKLGELISEAEQDMVWIEKDGITKRIHEYEIDDYADWNIHASTKRSEEAKQRMKDAAPEGQRKRLETLSKMYGSVKEAYKNVSEKSKQTCLIRYGKEYIFQVEEFKEKAKQTRLEKYGKEYFTQTDVCINAAHTPEINDQRIQTRIERGNWSTSKPEEEMYLELCNEYGENDVYRNYNKDPRYPFHCDFYIKSEDLFIELNAFFTHGPHPFNPLNEDDIELVNKWKRLTNGNDLYSEAVRIWTINDPLKLKTAVEEGLNYVTIY